MSFAISKTLLAAAAALSVALSASAQSAPAHPDFSGAWVMDSARSERGPLTPSSLTLKIVRRGDTITVASNATSMAGATSATVTYGLDGKTWKNSITQGGIQIDLNSVLSWDGPTLVIKTTADVQGQQLLQTDAWTLDTAGKTMTIVRTVDAAGQQYSTRLILAHP